jgi:hypothetical protein
MMGTVCSHFVVQKYCTQTYHFTRDEFQSKLEQHFGAV